MRRRPETTRKSGVALAASVTHMPPLRLAASSWMVGVPPIIANCNRNSSFLSPSQVTVRVSPETDAVRPGNALYSVRRQFSGSAFAAGPRNRMAAANAGAIHALDLVFRSEEHTSELQS